MDLELFEAFAELRDRPDVRAIIWRGEGKSFSSGRDVSSIGNLKVELTHHELMRRGHRGIQQIWEIDAPIIVAHKGWTMGGSFQRALLCDIRVAAEGARFRLPELTYGVIPDTGGFGTLFQIAGHGLVSDMVLTGRVAERRGGARARDRVARRPRRRPRHHGAGDGRADRGGARRPRSAWRGRSSATSRCRRSARRWTRR